jgi:hypothetical protein
MTTTTASCPSCGASVPFKSAASIFAVCEYCRSTLIRRGPDIENLGRMAELLEDASPIQLGTEGRYRGVQFAVIGRIQLRYGQGVWSEWHLLFDDRRTGWLSDASGEYVLSFLRWVSEPLPAFGELKIQQWVHLDGRPYSVTNLESATCVSGAGELPFRIGPGYDASVADLRAGTIFATIDYSDVADGKPPLVFIGEAVSPKTLALTNLRQAQPAPSRKVEARALRCLSCGAPLSLHSSAIETVACGSCSAILDVADEGLKILSKSQGALKEKPALPLGSKGRLSGTDFEIIGYLRRHTKVEGISYAWREYLLHNAATGFRWLTEYNGHWNFVETVSDMAGSTGSTGSAVRHRGRVFEHFQSATAEVDYVLGEFYWRVRQGETAKVADYISPPFALSRELTSSEVTWSLGNYLEPGEVKAAFKPPAALPSRIGIGANQPSPWEERHRKVCRAFWRLALAAIVLQLGTWLFSSNKTLLTQHFTFTRVNAEETLTTEPFKVSGKASNLYVRNRTNLNNSWVGLDLSLVERDTGESYEAAREISYYEGYDEGEKWTEGSRDDEVVFKGVPQGTYYLAIDAELPMDRPTEVSDLVEVVSGAPVWSNLALVLIFLVLFPVFTRWRWASFEMRRWADSDHPRALSSSDDDD